MSWSPQGDRLAYFVRTEHDRSLIVQNVVTAQDRVARPAERHRRAGVAGLLARRQADRVLRHAERGRRHLHDQPRHQGDQEPHPGSRWRTTRRPGRRTASPSSTSTRVSGNEKLFRINADGSDQQQITFGTHDEGGAQFWDADTLVFAVNGGEPGRAHRPGGLAQRADLQPVDAELQDQRAEAVHRRADRQPVAGGAARRRAASGWRLSPI